MNYDKTGSNNPNWKGGKTFCECGGRKGSEAMRCHSCHDQSGKNNPFYGRTHSKEVKEEARQRALLQERRGEKPVIVDGKSYVSVRACARALDIYSSTVIGRLKSDKFPEYSYA